ncbi:MAG: hypothetical protein HYR70_02355 [Chloroflexi bacterium]|nr:hypothetical protein [Chloroflexota bacterium]MBI1855680.1 hypothetical protein [Chloroflexota bacterium]MBI2758050.1 hypothetical protein [Chloroflexota bacterium]MBI3340968.1 hypothetical protein [Chloroflexota bacterium]
MYTLAPDEKKSLVMIYTLNSLVRGEIVTKSNVRVSIWLRTQGVPQYMHLLNADILLLGGSPIKSLSYSEFYFSTPQAIAFHLAPSESDPLDYEESEANRTMMPIDLIVGMFVVHGKIRVSTHTDIDASLEMARLAWMSVYDASISNPYLPQMPVIQVPMLLVSPPHVSFAK